MPREYAKVWFSMLTDEHFTNQPRFDKLLYVALLAQPSMNLAGVLPLNFKRLGKAMRDGDQQPSEGELKAALNRLEEQEYAFTDGDTGEVLVRAFMRRDEVWKQPNVFVASLQAVANVESPKLCAVLASELERIEFPVSSSPKVQTSLARASAAAFAHVEPLTKGLPKPFPKPFPEGLEEGLPATWGNEGLPKPLGEGLPKGLPKPPVSVSVSVSTSRTANGYVGEYARENENAGAVESQPSNEPPRTCSKHIDNPDPPPCGPCANFRKAHERWQIAERRRLSEAYAAERRAMADLALQEIASCSLCDESGYIGTRVCDHNPNREQVAADGIAKVREALKRKASA